jgi:DNA-binding beta-propeller fold protein YncE
LLALGWLCQENGLVSAARNWNRTLSIFSVIYLLPVIGANLYSLFVLGGTFNFNPSAELLPLSLEIVPILLIWAFIAVPLLAAYLTLRTMRSETAVAGQNPEIRTGRVNPVWLGLGTLTLVMVAAFIVNFLVFTSYPKLAWEYPFDDGAIAVAPDGKIYAFDRIEKQLLVLDSDGKLLKTVDLNIKPGAWLRDAAIGTDGNLYVVDAVLQSVHKFDRDGNLLKSWGAPTTGATAKVNKDALSFPQGIALDAQNNVYIANIARNNIVKFDSDGQIVEHFGSYMPGLGSPQDVALDTQGNIYVADGRDYRIKKLNPTGVIMQEWGGRGNQRGAFQMIFGVATDRDGFIYATDMHNHRIQKFDANGRFITQWSTGTNSRGGPRQLKVGSDGAVYVVNEATNTLQKFVF